LSNKRYHPDQITSYLYLGSEWNNRRDILEELGITYVLNVKDSCRFLDYPEHFLHIGLSDFGNTDLFKKFDQCFEFLDEARKNGAKVLCHCQAGINRSPTIVIAYLMKTEGRTLKQSYDLVISKRPMISPHEKYFDQLLALERQLFGENTMDRDSYPSVQNILRKLQLETAQEKEAEKEAEKETNKQQMEKDINQT